MVDNNKTPRATGYVAALALLGGAFSEASEPESRKSVTATRVSERPAIDGKLDEPMWREAAMFDDLLQIRPTDGAPGSERTEVLVAYDADYLYIGARLYDAGGPSQITAKVMRQGSRLAEDDRLGIILDPFNSARTGYRFEVNLNGVRNDMLYQGNQFSGDWTVIWDTQATLTDYGWSVEIAIPFKTLPFDASVDAWGFNVSRAIRRKGEESIWVSRNRTWNPSIVGELRGLRDVDQGIGLDIVPSVGIKHVRDEQRDREDTLLEPSLDAYYRLTPSLNASLTINTDFSATELDDRQVNLTRFGLFFPEKRDFFLNDSDLFEFGRIGLNGYLSGERSPTRANQESARPFFSRRIGLSPAGTPVDLEYGGKLSGRVGPWRLGALAVQQDAYRPLTGTGYDAKALGVLRASLDVLAESSVGFIGTSGDPVSDAGNSLYGFDFLYLNSRLPGGRSLEAEGWYQRSQTSGIPVGREDAWGVGARLPNTQGWRGGIALKQIGSQFRPALGFVSRRGVRDSLIDAGYTRIVDGRVFQQFFSGLDAQRIDAIGGDLQTQVITLRPLEFETRERRLFRSFVGFTEERLATPFTIYQDVRHRVVLPAGSYRWREQGAEFEVGIHEEYAWYVTARTGEFYDGDRFGASAGIIWRPSKPFAGRFNYAFTDIDLPYGSFSTRVLTAGADVNFSSRLSWITLLQYDNVSETAGMQSRLQWVPKAGQKYFLVLNHGAEDLDKDGNFRGINTEVSVRAGYTWRF
ncbi:MAG: sugar-binding protein [Steroidobacteraceae bacterium]